MLGLHFKDKVFIRPSLEFGISRKNPQNAIIPFYPDMEKTKGKGFSHKGKEFIHHSDLSHNETAFYNLISHQKIILLCIGAAFIVAFLIDWHATLVLMLGAMTLLYFADLLFNGFLIYRSFSKSPEIKVNSQEVQEIKEEDFPPYTIFCPLYKEGRVVPQFVDAMNKLDYPKDKLQILFLLEEDDKETIDAVKKANLPKHFQTVIVPHSSPKTKPKAMNYGLLHATGDYIVIYDAEDVPDPQQLKKALLAFEKLGAKTVCVQAKLNFYNPKQNILTRVFTAEYSLWFDLILTGLQSLNAPIPLGGTSNHFKRTYLEKLKGWDAFNVTEDCDLGMRLAKRGYQTAIMDSTTFEEANSNLKNWYRQRSRWIKGYIQTYFVHMRYPGSFSKGGKYHLYLFQLVVGGKILSMFINPFMWVITISYFVFRAQTGPFIESFFPGPILMIGVFSFIFGNFLYLYYYMIGCAKREHDDIIKYAFLVPFYWIAMSTAAWQALYEIMFKPHYWAKTIHGLHLSQEGMLAKDNV